MSEESDYTKQELRRLLKNLREETRKVWEMLNIPHSTPDAIVQEAETLRDVAYEFDLACTNIEYSGELYEQE